jgi:phage gpG-like protein
MASGHSIEIEVFGEDIIRRRLLRMGERGADATQGFKAIASILRRSTELNFASEGASSGEPWAPLAESTLKAKKRKGQDEKILQATHALKNSLLGWLNSRHIQVITPTEMRWGSRVSYGRYHQKGTDRIPRRPPVRLRETDKRSAVKAMQRVIVGAE